MAVLVAVLVVSRWVRVLVDEVEGGVVGMGEKLIPG
jgi:hypothetical protein